MFRSRGSDERSPAAAAAAAAAAAIASASGPSQRHVIEVAARAAAAAVARSQEQDTTRRRALDEVEEPRPGASRHGSAPGASTPRSGAVAAAVGDAAAAAGVSSPPRRDACTSTSAASERSAPTGARESGGPSGGGAGGRAEPSALGEIERADGAAAVGRDIVFESRGGAGRSLEAEWEEEDESAEVASLARLAVGAARAGARSDSEGSSRWAVGETSDSGTDSDMPGSSAGATESNSEGPRTPPDASAPPRTRAFPTPLAVRRGALDWGLSRSPMSGSLASVGSSPAKSPAVREASEGAAGGAGGRSPEAGRGRAARVRRGVRSSCVLTRPRPRLTEMLQGLAGGDCPLVQAPQHREEVSRERRLWGHLWDVCGSGVRSAPAMCSSDSRHAPCALVSQQSTDESKVVPRVARRDARSWLVGRESLRQSCTRLRDPKTSAQPTRPRPMLAGRTCRENA